MNLNLFARLTKFDESTGEFEAVAADQTVDKANERFHYETSKPYFKAWSDRISKATDGKSAGNVRSMHGKSVAGKLTQMLCDDAESAIKVAGKIVDPVDQKKFAEGCYAGVSIGGQYVKKWEDTQNPGVMWYTADPAEISIVDNPCNPSAYFKLLHADGTEELRKFNSASADEGTSPASPGTNADATPSAEADPVAKVAERSDTSPKEGENKYGDVKFADEKNKKYPIDNPEHISAAWNYINKPKNAGKYSAEDVKSIKAKIIAAWKEKIDKDGPPSADKMVEGADCEKLAALDCRAAFLAKHAPAQRTIEVLATAMQLDKGMAGISRLAMILDQLALLAGDCAGEAMVEGDNSAVPADLRESVKQLGQILMDMTDEEVQEIVSNYEEGEVVDMIPDLVIELSAKVDALAKAGKKYSGSTMGMLQSMHDTLSQMTDGAVCKSGDDETSEKVEHAPMTKVAKAVLDETTTELSKARAENKGLLEKVATLEKRVEELEKLPAAKAPVLRVVGKGDSEAPGAPAETPVEPVKVGGKVDELATAIKAIHAKSLRKS